MYLYFIELKTYSFTTISNVFSVSDELRIQYGYKLYLDIREMHQYFVVDVVVFGTI